MLEGAKLKSLIRRGTFLIFTLDTGDRLIVRPGVGGQLRKSARRTPSTTAPAWSSPSPRAASSASSTPAAPASSGCSRPSEVAEGVDEIELLGYDVVDQPVPWADFAKAVLQRSVKLKTLLTDEDLLTGVGNVYSDEILYDAGLRYDRLSDTLSVQEVRRLYRSVVEILHDAIKHGGTTLADDGWHDLHGAVGGYTGYHQVHARDGEPCRRCRDVISKAKFGGKSTWFCEQCQT